MTKPDIDRMVEAAVNVGDSPRLQAALGAYARAALQGIATGAFRAEDGIRAALIAADAVDPLRQRQTCK